MSSQRLAFRGISNIATLGAIISLGAIFSKQHWLLDLISHFRVQYIVLLVPAFLIACMVRKTTCLMIISLAIAVHGYAVMFSNLPETRPVSATIATTDNLKSVPTSSTNDSVEIKVLSSNLLYNNSNFREQLSVINTVQPDVIAFQEYTNEWHTVLAKHLSDKYPHQSNIPTGHAFGIALFSRYPITSGGIERLSVETPYVVNATIALGDKIVRLITVHPDAPYSISSYKKRNVFLKLLGEKIAKVEEPLVVMGDFNATPWTAHYSDLVRTAKLRNARAGFGLQPTWPSGFFPLSIPIDHILINRYIDVSSFSTIHVEGSDHRVIWASLQVF